MTQANKKQGLSVKNVRVSYRIGGSLLSKKRIVNAVRDVSFDVERGQTLGIVGESGCGKSSLARALVGLTPTSAGEVYWDGHMISGLSEADFRPLRKDIQMVFQDPFASLNPRMKVQDIVAEPLRTHEPDLPRSGVALRTKETLALVGMPETAMSRYRHELSGGQAQRVAIARAVVTRPGLLICDEAVSALDVSVQATVLNLFQDLQEELNLAIVFISHDLGVVQYVSDKIAVLYLGQVVESGPPAIVLNNPAHPYTELLRSSSLSPSTNRISVTEQPAHAVELPSPMDLPEGCAFQNRCSQATKKCDASPILTSSDSVERIVLCHHPLSP